MTRVENCGIIIIVKRRKVISSKIFFLKNKIPTNVGIVITYLLEEIMKTKQILIKLQEMGVSISKIGEKTNIHRSTLSKWLNEKGGLSLSAEERILEYLKKWKEELDKIFV